MTATTFDEVVLRAERVRRTYRRGPELVLALAPTSFDLRRGEVMAVTGPSGSGKTTLCDIVAGWQQPDGGRLAWTEELGSTPAWRQVAAVPQRLGLSPELTIAENVMLPILLAGVEGRDVDEVLAELDLLPMAGRLPEEVSLGEQQRAAIGRALVARPATMVLDEPTGHQDEDHVEQVIASVARAADDGAAVMVATHDQRVIAAADRRIDLTKG